MYCSNVNLHVCVCGSAHVGAWWQCCYGSYLIIPTQEVGHEKKVV